jgi:hypothetical protein
VGSGWFARSAFSPCVDMSLFSALILITAFPHAGLAMRLTHIWPSDCALVFQTI